MHCFIAHKDTLKHGGAISKGSPAFLCLYMMIFEHDKGTVSITRLSTAVFSHITVPVSKCCQMTAHSGYALLNTGLMWYSGICWARLKNSFAKVGLPQYIIIFFFLFSSSAVCGHSLSHNKGKKQQWPQTAGHLYIN